MSLDNYFNIPKKKKSNINIDKEADILFYMMDNIENLYDKVNKDIPWVQPEVKMYGKTFKPKRQVATMGKPYNYNGNNSTEITPIPESIQEIMMEVNKITHNEYNTCIANYYPDGNAYISMHDDGEESSESIASLSLGATRQFIIQNKLTKLKHKLDLSNGEIIEMKGKNFQKNWVHGIPKQLSIKEPRISLTFRKY